MIRSLWTSATGMQAQALNLDVIANNLANVNTAGFKKSRAEFQDLLYETLRPAGTSSSQRNSRARIASCHSCRDAICRFEPGR